MSVFQKKLTFNIQHYNETIIGGTYQVPLLRYLKNEKSKKWENHSDDSLLNNETIYDYSSNDKNSKIKNLIEEIFFLDNKFEMASYFNQYGYSYSPQTILIPNEEVANSIKINNKSYFLKTGDFSVFGNKDPIKNNEGHSGIGVHLINENNANWLKSKMKKNKKYILQESVQNIMLNEGRKFDIRTHVLFLKTGNRFKMFMWNNSYLRICVDKYDETSLDSSIHLTNIHRQHYKKGFNFNTHQKLLSDLPEYESLNENIRDACKELFFTILRGVKFDENDGPAFWIVGLDFIIDRDLKPWLIEINHNPGFLGEQNPRKYKEINYKSVVDFADNILEKILKNQTVNDNQTGNWKLVSSVILPDSTTLPPNKQFFTPSYKLVKPETENENEKEEKPKKKVKQIWSEKRRMAQKQANMSKNIDAKK